MKAALVRLGIRGFNPKRRNAPHRAETLRTPEGTPIPPNTLAELQREMAHYRFVNEQIKQIEDVRLKQLKQAPGRGPNATVLQLEQVRGLGIETADMLANEVFFRDFRDQQSTRPIRGAYRRPPTRAASAG